MIRTAAALFARKTAVVAITGAVVLGGATFALAEIGAPPDADGNCGAGEVLGAEGLCEADPNAAVPEEPCTDDLETTDVDECASEEQTCTDDPETTDVDECASDEQTCTDDPETTDVDECASDDEDGEDGDDAGTEDLEEGLAGEHPENHGKYVSEAAKGGGDCAGLTGREKGQCVATVAKSDAGKPGADETLAEEVEVEETEETETEETETEETEAEVTEDASGDDTELETEAPAPRTTGKPAHAGAGGKGPKK